MSWLSFARRLRARSVLTRSPEEAVSPPTLGPASADPAVVGPATPGPATPAEVPPPASSRWPTREQLLAMLDPDADPETAWFGAPPEDRITIVVGSRPGVKRSRPRPTGGAR